MRNYMYLPDKKDFQRICKAISVLDAILSKEWEYRYYSYNSKWGEIEEFFEMRNGQGEQLLVLFNQTGCVINGIHSEYEDLDKNILTEGLPKEFHEFIFGEPVATLGTNFCIWTNSFGKWDYNETNCEDGKRDLLTIFDNNPETYISWAEEYFEDHCKEGGICAKTVKKLYGGEILTETMVLSVVDDFDHWNQLKDDLTEIGYSYDFS